EDVRGPGVLNRGRVAGIGKRGARRDAGDTIRKAAVRVVVSVQREAELLEIVGAARSIGGLTNFLHRRQQQSYEYPDNCNHHQQLNQCEAGRRPSSLLAVHDSVLPRVKDEDNHKSSSRFSSLALQRKGVCLIPCVMAGLCRSSVFQMAPGRSGLPERKLSTA